MKKLTTKQKQIASFVQRDCPVVPHFFRNIASACKVKTSDVTETISFFLATGVIRRFGAVLRHQKVLYFHHALVLWAVPNDHIGAAGKRLAALPYVSHCYQRKPAFQERYNLFTMMHFPQTDIASLMKEISETCDVSDYLILESLEEYKKTSPEYFL